MVDQEVEELRRRNPASDQPLDGDHGGEDDRSAAQHLGVGDQVTHPREREGEIATGVHVDDRLGGAFEDEVDGIGRPALSHEPFAGLQPSLHAEACELLPLPQV